MTSSSSSVPFEAIFPEAQCIVAMQELSAWTSVQDIAAAARCLANAPAPNDNFVTQLFLPFADDAILQHVAIKAIDWFIKGYRAPAPKLHIAALDEPLLDVARQQILGQTRFEPTITIARPNIAASRLPNVPRCASDGLMIVEDEPHVIEMVQGPLRCLMGLVIEGFEIARKGHMLKKVSLQTSESPLTIFHHPHADSPLKGVLEALSFYALGLDFGPRWCGQGETDIEVAYRAVNVRATPPVDSKMFDAAKAAAASILSPLT
jgi:hypothetical protein